jgi:hypothetical protein
MDDLGEEFGERFVRERTDEIDVNGKKVILRKEISSVYPGCRISISFEGYSAEVEQALCLATTHGSFKL